MATLGDLLATKGHEVIAVQPSDTVLQAANLMNDRNIGGVVVLDGDRLAGIFTERDVLRRVVAQGLDPAETTVAEVMTVSVITCPPDLSIEDCAAVMTTRGVRHLPVLDGDRLVGVLSLGDLVKETISEQEFIIQQLENYIHG